ncbi:cysteine/glutathione ABC transporter permease/ATP-binding protein CydD [Shewanella sp. 202IG2-18]|uniref:heme ABC transporter permease/ATP-binding protein CydD n=1 Tax=Parashewanella hymeniacidonis TaxID=2807618 RepID=UPI001960168A|nr:cysteine/glutathione ABC transporter permease/ATP-binding protein CydD [Parashewanella hymeniacidonis]MBM7070835.1 cysteine/glutathione ABC transporter permease/ATP-binding protein CydD [Parashewanella hymeniacidonis]
MNPETERKTNDLIQKWGRSARRPISLSVFLGVLQGVIIVVQSFFVAQTLHDIIILDNNELLIKNLIIIFSLTCLRAIVHVTKERVSFKAGEIIRKYARQSMLQKLDQLGPIYLKSKPEGYWNSLLLEQVEQLQDYYSRYLPQRSLIAFIPLIILVVIFPQSWIAGLILLITAPLIPLFMILVGKSATKASQQHNQALQKLTSYFADRLSGLSTLKLFYRYQAELKGVSQVSEDFQNRTMSVLKRAFLSSAVLEFFSSVSIALLAVYLGFSFLEYIDTGFYGVKVTLFSAMFILLLAPEFYQPLRELGTFYHAKSQAVASAESILELLSTPTPNRSMQADFSSGISVEATNLIVKTHSETQLLGPISFHWRLGESIAIVGRSGCGKSSLVNVILGFLPYDGSLKVNGVELKTLDLRQWHQQLAWLGQMPHLVSETLKANLMLGNDLIKDETLKLVLDEVGLSHLKSELTKKIGEKNYGVSVGQAQRIALARVLLTPKRLLILDEPTAALDGESQFVVWQNLSKLLKASGGLFVTHKMEEMQVADKIWLIENNTLTIGEFADLYADIMPFTDRIET